MTVGEEVYSCEVVTEKGEWAVPCGRVLEGSEQTQDDCGGLQEVVGNSGARRKAVRNGEAKGVAPDANSLWVGVGEDIHGVSRVGGGRVVGHGNVGVYDVVGNGEGSGGHKGGKERGSARAAGADGNVTSDQGSG